ncbi:hypothetical protein AVEN_214916-1 [Araneus ventricosus]|uniref:Uncharacterized protein n=1 Tax=Araneus ventricosus TaxID=182803 RepID=A0A4Y2DAS8_ARAVE|nr:hypothetical protein AVEN_214916-1 [Araneus ventricosus]
MVKTPSTKELQQPSSPLDPNFLTENSPSRPAGRKKSLQGAAEPSTLNVSQENLTPANDNSHGFKWLEMPISGSKQDTAGHSLPLTTSYLWEKNFSGPLFAAVTFSQITKAITPRGKKFGKPDVLFFSKQCNAYPRKFAQRRGRGKIYNFEGTVTKVLFLKTRIRTKNVNTRLFTEKISAVQLR